MWTSTRIDNSLNPIWSATKILLSALCNGDIYRPLKINIYDWNKNGKHEPMGEVMTSVDNMLTNNEAAMPVIEPDQILKKKKGYVNSGFLVAKNVSIEKRPTFTDVSCYCYCNSSQ